MPSSSSNLCSSELDKKLGSLQLHLWQLDPHPKSCSSHCFCVSKCISLNRRVRRSIKHALRALSKVLRRCRRRGRNLRRQANWITTAASSRASAALFRVLARRFSRARQIRRAAARCRKSRSRAWRGASFRKHCSAFAYHVSQTEIAESPCGDCSTEPSGFRKALSFCCKSPDKFLFRLG